MGVKEYCREWWLELWNPDSRAWQIIDRVLFILLPVIFLVFFFLTNIPNKDSIPQNWKDIMANLGWIIPLAIWLLFLLVIVPFNLAGKYKRKYVDANIRILELQKPDKKLVIREQLAEYWEEGFNLQRLLYNLAVPMPEKQIDEWAAKVGSYLHKNMGRDYTTTFIDISTLKSSVLPVPSPERQNSFVILYNGLSHLQQFMKDLRD